MLRTVASLCTLVLAGIAAVVDPSPAWVERVFSTGLYPAVQRLATGITMRLPFALFDVMVVAVSAAALGAVWRSVGHARRDRSLRPLGRVAWNLSVVAAALYLVFLLSWGLNYRRLPMRERVIVADEPASTEAVLALGARAVQQLNRLYAEAHAAGWATPEWQDAALVEAARRAQASLVPGRTAQVAPLKDSVFGPYFRWTGVDGMVNPFGLEVLANPDLLPFERPFVAAHEWAHLAGFADEAEASFVGFLTCMHGSVGAQYSGWFSLYWQISVEVDAAARADLQHALQPGPIADLRAVSERIRRGQLPRLRLFSWRVYDSYLRANRVSAGIRRYGEVVDMLARTRFDAGWARALRARD